MYSIGKPNPQLKMRAHMQSFKSIKQSEMIRNFQKNKDNGFTLSPNKEKKRVKNVQQPDDFKLSVFKECIDKMDDKLFER